MAVYKTRNLRGLFVSSYKKVYGDLLHRRALISSGQVVRPMQSKRLLGRSKAVAIICPGAFLASNYPERGRYDRVMAINLAAAAELGLTDILYERVSFDYFGDIQFNLIKNRVQECQLYAKNTWSSEFFPEQRRKECLEQSWIIRDVPLRGSAVLSEKFVLHYMLNTEFGFSNWKSSLFVAVDLAIQMGASTVDIFGAGGHGYFWEQHCPFTIQVHSDLLKIENKGTHKTRLGRPDADRIMDCFIKGREASCGVKITKVGG